MYEKCTGNVKGRVQLGHVLFLVIGHLAIRALTYLADAVHAAVKRLGHLHTAPAADVALNNTVRLILRQLQRLDIGYRGAG